MYETKPPQQQTKAEDERAGTGPRLLTPVQPSQVYFPKLLVSRGDSAEEDIEAVRKAFMVLSNAVSDANGRLQVIVLDQAPESVWAGLPNATWVEEWRGGKKLVPAEWLV